MLSVVWWSYYECRPEQRREMVKGRSLRGRREASQSRSSGHQEHLKRCDSKHGLHEDTRDLHRPMANSDPAPEEECIAYSSPSVTVPHRVCGCGGMGPTITTIVPYRHVHTTHQIVTYPFELREQLTYNLPSTYHLGLVVGDPRLSTEFVLVVSWFFLFLLLNPFWPALEQILVFPVCSQCGCVELTRRAVVIAANTFSSG